jgi:ribonuclease HI
MNDFSSLAFKSERAASRKLAQRLGISERDALLQTLTLSAGAQGLERLLAQRRALREADAKRTLAQRERNEIALARTGTLPISATTWQAWFDGSARPNPGRLTIGGVVLAPDGQRIELSEDAGYGDSSAAEYRALIAVLEAARKAGADELAVHGDSKVVIDDVNGATADAAPALAEYRDQVRGLLRHFARVQLRWVPRHRNPDADALSQRSAVSLN